MTSVSGHVTGTVAGRRGADRYQAGQVTVVSGGRIDLRVTVPPRSLRVTGGRGPTLVELPRGAAYDIETDAFPTGRRDISVPSVPDAPHLVTVRSDGGDVTVRYVP